MGLEKVIKNIRNGFLSLVLAGSMVACTQVTPNPPQNPTKQTVEVDISYTGNLNASNTGPFAQHDIICYLLDQNGNGFSYTENLASLSNVNSQKLIFNSIPPGNYQVYAGWDWNDDKSLDYAEPISPKESFNVDGYNTIKVPLTISDNASPAGPGYVEGRIYYNGPDKSDYHFLLTVVEDLNYHILSNKTSPFQVSFPNGSSYYIMSAPTGGPYRVIARWENNLDYPDNPDYGSVNSYPGFVYVAPGMSTDEVDITLPSN